MKHNMRLKLFTFLLAIGTISCSKVQFSPTESLDQGSLVVDPIIPTPVPEEPPPVVVNPPPVVVEPPPVVVEPPPVVVEPPPVVVNPPPVVVEPPPVVVEPPPVVVEPTPVNKTEQFTQAVAARKLDILFVMDNSDSMFMDYYRDIQNKFNGFLSSLNGLDYRVGVITTDVEHTELYNYKGAWGLLDFLGSGFQKTSMRFLTSATSNANTLLLNTLKRDEVADCRKNAPHNQLPCGSDNEQPLASIVRSVSRASENANFYRSDAELITIAVSDEDEYSTGGSNTTQPSQVISAVRTNLGASKAYRAFGVVIRENDIGCYNSQRSEEIFGQAAAYGRSVTRLAEQTGGGVISICNNEFVSGLNAIANGAWSEGAVQSVTLSQTPVAGSVQVTLSPSNGITWTISGKTITFSSKPVAGTSISVSYKHMP